ncbi:MAG TPA: ECF-type sigma factor [Kofleriaceae bacterium]
MGDITALLLRAREGDDQARTALVPLVYADLEVIANAYLRGKQDASFAPGDLVHELYLRLAGSQFDANDRKHFLAAAAMAMRQILIDRARKKGAAKRGGDAVRVTLSGLADDRSDEDLSAVAEALQALEAVSPRQARVVEMRCLLGLSMVETADALGISERTVRNEWRVARAWLTAALRAKM